MIHCTTYTSPNGSTLGALIESRHGHNVQFVQQFTRADAGNVDQVLEYLTNEDSPHYLGQTGVVYKTERVSLRDWYGIS